MLPLRVIAVLWPTLVPMLCFAQQANDEHAAALYLESIAMQKRAPICSSRVPGFAKTFDPAFAKWKQSTAQSLQHGETFLRSAMTAASMDFDKHVGAVTDTAARVLEEASPKIVLENCNAMLELVGAR